MTEPRPIVTFGETMGLLSAEAAGPLWHGARLTATTGGTESNAAIALARLGVPVVWIGRVGDDEFGRMVARDIRGEGVQAHVIVDAGARTGLMLKLRPTPGTQSVVYHRTGSAGSRLRPGDVPAEVVAGASVLHLTGITAAISETARQTLFEAVAVAKSAGVPISFDVNHRSSLWSESAASDLYRELLPAADLVFAGVDEARLAIADWPGRTALGPDELAVALAAHGATAVVKLGEQGAVACAGGELVGVPAVPVEAIDTVGAGDAFVAGFLAEWVAGRGLIDCLATATAAGARACLVPGDWEGAPRRSELGAPLFTDAVLR
ncbi:sugar kinase [Gryllotalpicola protaetiae]|uniref:Sugar kinase n=1 Tax=Gryllotalpicola protaetiae TaxID=2419771 RepID=A0A387BRR7_9MICO|nr:sugar kinase [Gryllotalpicola protaetiae]AYG03637.1 sugar kinase [Gryllotalpicola protaetiae]